VKCRSVGQRRLGRWSGFNYPPLRVIKLSVVPAELAVIRDSQTWRDVR